MGEQLMPLGSSGVLLGLGLFVVVVCFFNRSLLKKVQTSPCAQQAGLCSSQKIALKKYHEKNTWDGNQK